MTQKWQTEWQVFLLAVQFMTRLPVPGDVPYSDDLLIRATRYYPLVGLLVGTIGAVVLLVSESLLPVQIAVLLSMAATVFATGALHEDGLADAADGLGGGTTHARVLDIMRDSRIGIYGAVTLGFVLAIKASVMMTIPVSDMMVALIVGHVLSRMAAVQVVSRDSYAREEGAKFVTPSVTSDGYWFALTTTGAVLAVSVAWFGLGATLVSLVVAAGLSVVFRAMFPPRQSPV